jgi:hypothetical protein
MLRGRCPAPAAASAALAGPVEPAEPPVRLVQRVQRVRLVQLVQAARAGPGWRRRRAGMPSQRPAPGARAAQAVRVDAAASAAWAAAGT